MAIDIRLPNINGSTEAEQLYQIKRYLYQLAEELKYNLNTLEAGTSDEASIDRVGIIDSLNNWKLAMGNEISSIATIRQKVSSHGASITSLAEWKDSVKDDVSGIAQIEQDVTDQGVRISSLAEWRSGIEGDVSSIASIEQRVRANELTIETLTKINDGDVESLASIVSRVTANETNINTLTEWKNGAVSSIASIDTLAKANQASIGLVVDNGVVKGSILISAINDESVAKISADRLDIEGKTLNIKVDHTNINGKLVVDQIDVSGILQASKAEIEALATGVITADHIRSLGLEVGNQITMGANAKISWYNVENKPSDLATITQVTTITNDTISTTDILAQNLKVYAVNIKEQLTASQVDVEGILTAGEAQIKALAANTIMATDVLAQNLRVSAAHIDGTITAKQIDVTDLNAFGATIGGFTIDNNSIHSQMRTDNRILLCSGTSASYTVGDFTSTGWSILAGKNFGVLKNGTMYATNANISGKITSHEGEIGGWNVNSQGLYYGESEKEALVVFTPTGESIPYPVAGAVADWIFRISDKFAISSEGKLYCNEGYFRNYRSPTHRYVYLSEGKVQIKTDSKTVNNFLCYPLLEFYDGEKLCTLLARKNNNTWDLTVSNQSIDDFITTV